MEYLKAWSVTLILLTAAGGFMEMMLPEGNMKKYVGFVFALMILDAFISPVALFIR